MLHVFLMFQIVTGKKIVIETKTAGADLDHVSTEKDLDHVAVIKGQDHAVEIDEERKEVDLGMLVPCKLCELVVENISHSCYFVLCTCWHGAGMH
jgi:hypothetical protein